MGRRSTLGEEIERDVKKFPHVTATNLGKHDWGRGKLKLKMQNGTPGLVTIEICESESKRTLYVYTKDCPATMASVRAYASKIKIPIIG